MTLIKEFHNTLAFVESELQDRGQTSNKQLEKFGKKHFGKKFGGILRKMKK